MLCILPTSHKKRILMLVIHHIVSVSHLVKHNLEMIMKYLLGVLGDED